MPFTTSAMDTALTQIGATYGFLSLHTAYSATGTNELTGGSPVYARQSVTWGSAAANSMASTATGGAFNVPAGNNVAFVGLWTAASSGTFGGMGPNGGAAQFAFTCPTASPGVFTAPGSAYANGTQVVLLPTLALGSAIPAGFTVGTVYFIVNVSGATFQLSATSGGAAINATGAGNGIVQGITVESFTAQGTFTVSTETLSLV